MTDYIFVERYKNMTGSYWYESINKLYKLQNWLLISLLKYTFCEMSCSDFKITLWILINASQILNSYMLWASIHANDFLSDEQPTQYDT